MTNSIKLWSNQKLIDRVISNKVINDNAYWCKIHELRRRGSKDIYSCSKKLCKSKDFKEKTIGIDILAQFGSPNLIHSKEVTQLLLQMLKKEKDPRILNSLLVSLGHNNKNIKSKDIDFLNSFQTHENSDVRYGLVFALLGKEYKNAITTLITMSKDKSKLVRDWATFGLGTQIEKNSKIIRDALWSRVIDDDQDTRLEAIVGLAKRQDPKIKDVIIEELKNGEYGTLLFEAVLEIGDYDFLKYLNKNLKDANNEDDINSDWINDLKNCIKELKKIIKHKKKTQN